MPWTKDEDIKRVKEHNRRRKLGLGLPKKDPSFKPIIYPNPKNKTI